MINITDINDIEVIIRNKLIEQSQLDSNYVRNSLSLYGPELDQELCPDIFDSIATTQNLIIFELRANSTGNDRTETINNKIKFYKSYTVHIIIYGENSNTLANVLIGRFRTEEVQEDLESQGIYLETIEDIESIHEFINDVMWLRNDFKINIACEMSINKISDNNTFNSISQLTIIGGK